MVVQVLAIRTRPPPLRARTVARARLFRLLDEGAERRLTVVSAPAGFGKTTLVTEWAARRTGHTAWLGVAPGDREPRRFLLLLVAALRAAGVLVSDAVDASLGSSRPPASEAILIDVFHAVDAFGGRVVLVMDDLHALEGAENARAVAFLVEHAPDNLRIVCTTRVRPDLPLARLRARDQLREIGPAELAFTSDEAEAFLSEVMQLALPADLAQRLVERTEGWVAGLQLASLSLAGAEDAGAFVTELGGDHRHIFDYLVEEVLAELPAEVRSFLLETSVLERMTAPLCGAVTGHPAAAEQLDALERKNLFVLPLDERRAWYRYHPLFADALRAILDRERPDAAAHAHRRASAWFEAEGSSDEAVHHAFASGDMSLAARLVELAWRHMDRNFRTGPWLAWAEALPEDEVRRRPVLGVGMAWARLSAGDVDGAARDLAAAEGTRAHDEHDVPGMEGAASDVETDRGHARAPETGDRFRVDDPVAYAALPARILGAKAFLSQSEGRGADAERFAREAMAVAPEDDPSSRGIPAGLLGLSRWARGDLEGAVDALRASAAAFHAVGDLAAALSTTFGTAEALLARGRLDDAERELRGALARAAERGQDVFPGKAELLVALAETTLERGERDDAEAYLREAEALGPAGVLEGDQGRLPAAIAVVELGLGNVDATLQRLDEAERNWIATPMPDVRPIDAIRARAWVRSGRLEQAKAWLADASDASPPDYLQAYTAFTRVRVHLAAFRREDDTDSLERALRILGPALADGGTALGSRAAMEAYVLLALAREAAGDKAGAREAVGRALELAAPDGFAHVFLAEGMAVAGPLRAALRAGVATRHVRWLLASLRARDGVGTGAVGGFEPLTDREREVLRLLAGTLTGPQIARQLAMSVHTLRSHTKSIYAKLGVHSRKAAVARASELHEC